MLTHIFAACLMMAAQTYQVPPQVLVGILHVEGGKVGQQVRNTNGTYDLGPMQINTLWTKVLAKEWGVSREAAKRLIRDDACTNVNVAAWIFRKNLDETKSLSKAIAWYNSRTPHIGYRYKKKVLAAMKKQNLMPETSKKKSRSTVKENEQLAFMDKTLDRGE
jgi:soluble lytic murein transglycosylase-like protein